MTRGNGFRTRVLWTRSPGTDGEKDHAQRRRGLPRLGGVQKLRRRVNRADKRLSHQGEQLKAARKRLRTTNSELRQLRTEVEALFRLTGALVGEHPDTADFVRRALETSGIGLANTSAVRLLEIRVLLEAGRPLTADLIVQQDDLMAQLPLRHQRQLARQLRDRGFLARALLYSEAAAALGQPADVAALRFREGQARVLSGEFTPTLVPVALSDRIPGRVLHVVAHGLPDRQTGYTIRTHQTVRAQLAGDTDVHVVLQPGVTDGGVPCELLDGVPYHRISAPPRISTPPDRWLQAYAEALLGLVQELRPSVLHAHSDFHNLVAARAVGDATGVPVVYEARGFWEETWLSGAANTHQWSGLDPLDHLESTYGHLPEAYVWRRQREREACRLANRVVTLAEVMREEIVAAGVDPGQVALAPNAVDVEAFPVLERDENLAAELDLGPDTVVIGYVSSLVEYEGIDDLIRGFAGLRRRTAAPVHLLLIGDGAESDSLRRLAEEHPDSDITFTGRVPHGDVYRYYSLLDLFVVPRKPARVCHLVTPLKPFEAFATGRTVVMSDVRALAEISAASGAARLFRAGDPESLADVLAELVASPDLRRDLAKAGSDWVRTSRTWSANATTYEKVYESLGVRR